MQRLRRKGFEQIVAIAPISKRARAAEILAGPALRQASRNATAIRRSNTVRKAALAAVGEFGPKIASRSFRAIRSTNVVGLAFGVTKLDLLIAGFEGTQAAARVAEAGGTGSEVLAEGVVETLSSLLFLDAIVPNDANEPVEEAAKSLIDTIVSPINPVLDRIAQAASDIFTPFG